MSQPRIAPTPDRRRGIPKHEPRFVMKFKRQTMASRIRAQGALVTTQEQVDKILASVPKDIGDAWLNMFGPHLPFVPRQLQVEPVQPVREVT
jgi:hypothetical protein